MCLLISSICISSVAPWCVSFLVSEMSYCSCEDLSEDWQLSIQLVSAQWQELSCSLLLSHFILKSVVTFIIYCHAIVPPSFFPHLGHLQDLPPLVWSFTFDPSLNRCTFVNWSLFGSFYIDIKGSTTTLIWQLLPAIHRLQNTPVPWLLTQSPPSHSTWIKN